jgi:hypothetical protein
MTSFRESSARRTTRHTEFHPCDYPALDTSLPQVSHHAQVLSQVAPRCCPSTPPAWPSALRDQPSNPGPSQAVARDPVAFDNHTNTQPAKISLDPRVATTDPRQVDCQRLEIPIPGRSISRIARRQGFGRLSSPCLRHSQTRTAPASPLNHTRGTSEVQAQTIAPQATEPPVPPPTDGPLLGGESSPAAY